MKHNVITCKDGQKIRRLSRWIKVREAVNVSPRSCLFDYSDDDGEGNKLAFYFVFRGQRYALGRFIRCGSPWLPVSYSWEDEEGKMQFLSGADCTEYYRPLLIELDDAGEYVRVYEEA